MDYQLTLKLLLTAFAVSAGLSWVMIFLGNKFSIGIDYQVGAQKHYHDTPPRIGGIAFLSAIVIAGVIFYDIFELNDWIFFKVYLVTVLPAFLGGLIEDFTRQVSALARFVLTLSAAFLAYFAINATIKSFGVDFIDQLLDYKLVSLIVTALAIGGVANGTNMIDGMHGILLTFAVVAFGSYSFLAWQLDDFLFFAIAIISLGATLGVLVFNYPSGKIFSGDGGSYTIGFFLAVIAILLYSRNETKISPVVIGTVLSYPTIEVLFSIYRKGLAKMFVADGKHLHQLLFHVLNQKRREAAFLSNNALVNLLLLPLYSFPAIMSLIFINNSLFIIASFLVFAIIYLAIYFMLQKSTQNTP